MKKLKFNKEELLKFLDKELEHKVEYEMPTSAYIMGYSECLRLVTNYFKVYNVK